MQTVQKHEMDAQIETAMQTKMRCGYTQTAAIHKLWVNSRRFVLGFNFKTAAGAKWLRWYERNETRWPRKGPRSQAGEAGGGNGNTLPAGHGSAARKAGAPGRGKVGAGSHRPRQGT